MKGTKRIDPARITEDDANYPDKNSVDFINLIVEIIIEATLEQFHKQKRDDVIPSVPIQEPDNSDKHAP